MRSVSQCTRVEWNAIVICYVGNQLAIDVCILLIEVSISTYQLNLAASHIDFVEAKLFADSSRENGEFSPEDVEKYRSRLFLFKARLSLLHGNTKNCKKEIKGYTNASGNVSHSPCTYLMVSFEIYLHYRIPVQCYSKPMWST